VTAIGGFADCIDVSTISTLGIDSFDIPGHLCGFGGPNGVLVVGSAGSILLASVVPEEELVGSTVGSHNLTVLTPVDGGDVRGVSSALTEEVIRLVVDVNVVIVRTDSKLGAIGRGSKNLDPFSGVLEDLHFLTLVLNSDTSIIACNNQTIVEAADGTTLLRRGQGRLG